MLNSQVVIIGPYPPPIGGNSVHIQRLAMKCLSQGLDCRVVDPYASPTGQEPRWVVRFRGSTVTRIAQMLVWLILNPYSIVHVHVSAMDRFLMIGWLLHLATFKARLRVITVHSGSFVQRIKSRGPLARRIVASILRRFDCVIVVNERQRKFLADSLKITPSKVRVIPAFIPGSLEMGALPEPVHMLRKCSLLVVGSGYATSLYAHDLLVEAVRRLQEEGLDVGLVIAVYSQYEEPYYSKLKEKVNQTPKVLLLEELGPETFNALLHLADVYVRTARLDGDSVAVREALLHGCRVVASDCVERPEGCETFTTDNIDSLCTAMKRVAQKPLKVLSSVACRDYSEDVIAIYGMCDDPL